MGGRAGFGRRLAPVGRSTQHAARGRTGRSVRGRYRASATAGEQRCHDLVDSCAIARFHGDGLDPVDPRRPSKGNEPSRAERRPHGRRAARRATAGPIGVRVVVAFRVAAHVAARWCHAGDGAPRQGQGVARRHRAPRRRGSVPTSSRHRCRGRTSCVPCCHHPRSDERARRAGPTSVAVHRAVPATARSGRAGACHEPRHDSQCGSQ